MFDAVAREDLEDLIAASHPDIELVSAMAPAEGGAPYCGHDGVRQWWANTFATWDDYRLEPIRLLDLEPYVLGVFRVAGRGKTSGVPMERRIFLCIELEGVTVRRLFAAFELPSALRELASWIETGA
jgi:ketosteroid isomerase-like protein